MIIWKLLHIAKAKHTVEVRLKELLDSSDYAIFTWPSALLLAAFFVANPSIVHDRRIIELGAGTALPSVICGKLGAKKVIATERGEQTEMLQVIEEEFQLNQVDCICHSRPLTWGMLPLPTESHEIEKDTFDVIIGADVFYSSEDFDRLLLTVLHFFIINPKCVFYTTYQERR